MYEKLKTIELAYTPQIFGLAIAVLLDEGVKTISILTDEEIKQQKGNSLISDELWQTIIKVARSIATTIKDDPTVLVSYCQDNHFFNPVKPTKFEEEEIAKMTDYIFQTYDDIEELLIVGNNANRNELHDLDKLNIANDDYFTVKDTLDNQTLNIGFTYTDYYKKSTIVIIGLTTSAAEFQDTFDHEKGHVAMHISSYYHLNPYGEKC